MKEKLFNGARFFMFTAAIVQLALSQIHIAVITKVFEESVGFYLFLFIIFGIIVAFNSVNLKSGKHLLLDIVGVVFASAAGIKFISQVLNDIKVSTVLTFQDAQISLLVSVITIAIYIIGLIIIIFTVGPRKRD